MADLAREAEQLDVAVGRDLGRHRGHPAIRAAAALTELADQPPLLALSGAVVLAGLATGDARLAKAGGRMLASVAIATLIKGAVKRTLSRTRPNVLLDQGRYEVRALGPDEGPWHSFPSGHTAGAVAAAHALAGVYPEARLPAYAGAAAVAAALVPSARHYPADVAAGAAIGLASAALTDLIWRNLADRLALPPEGDAAELAPLGSDGTAERRRPA